MAMQGTWQGHQISIEMRWSLKNILLPMETLVKVDGVKVAQIRNLLFGDHVVSAFDHQEVSTPIEIKIKPGLFSPSYSIKIHDEIIMQGYLGTETINIMQFYFGIFGLIYITPALNFLIHPYRDMIFQQYDSFGIVAGAVVHGIVGLFLLYVSISLKYLLRNSLNLIVVALYTWIGIMIVTTPSAISNLMNAQTLHWQLGLGLAGRLLFIWFFGYFVVVCKRLSQEMKSQVASSNY